MIRSSIKLTFAALLAYALTSQAQPYPTKSVRAVIPWPAGGSNDVAGRVVMQQLSESLRQQFVIDNRAGAAGTIGADQVARAPADGYTLMVHSTTHLGNAHLYRKLSYDTLRDFAPVAMIASAPSVLVVHPSLPAQSVTEFVALAKARPGEINYASSGNGSGTHLAMALLTATSGIRLVHVPYKGGPQEVTALISGEATAAISTIATVIPHIQSGRLRALGVASAERSPTLPSIPTIAEAGIPGYEWRGWIAVFAPAGTPKVVIDSLSVEIDRALKSPTIAQSLSRQGLEPWIMGPDALGARIKSDYEKYGRLIKLTGARID